MSASITFDLFAGQMNQLYPCQKLPGFTDSFQITEFCLPDSVPDSCPVQASLILVTEEEYRKLHRKYPHSGFLIYTPAPASDTTASRKVISSVLQSPENGDPLPAGNALLVRQPLSAGSLLHSAFTVLHQYHSWKEQLLTLAANGDSAITMLTSASEYLDVRFFISSTTGDEHCFDTSLPDTLGIFTLTKEEVENIMTTKAEFPATFSTRGVQAFPSPYNGLLYYYNIMLDNSYLARILMVVADTPFVSGQLRMFRYLAPYAEQAYGDSHRNQVILRNNSELILLLEQISSGFSPDASALRDMLEPFGWDPEHTYQTLMFRTENLDQNTPSQNYFCSCVDSRFPSCCAILLSGNIYCIRNLSVESGTSGFMQQMKAFSRDNLCRVGFSNIRRGINNLPLLAAEADDAIRLGSARHPHYWTFRFKDYIFDSFREAVTAKYPPSELEHPALELLREQDKKTGSELYRTLKVFTEERFSASAAARELFIHRSTFLHRMERITELTSVDFDSKKDRASLTLSFFLND
ncbi:MAG: helix-turn-helix domain-containing protein [Lachnospiraceae bacterium]|nr:helix-turn-helix domain-containing protein [Lachnospiraceae bacterium]